MTVFHTLMLNTDHCNSIKFIMNICIPYAQSVLLLISPHSNCAVKWWFCWNVGIIVLLSTILQGSELTISSGMPRTSHIVAEVTKTHCLQWEDMNVDSICGICILHFHCHTIPNCPNFQTRLYRVCCNNSFPFLFFQYNYAELILWSQLTSLI